MLVPGTEARQEDSVGSVRLGEVSPLPRSLAKVRPCEAAFTLVAVELVAVVLSLLELKLGFEGGREGRS